MVKILNFDFSPNKAGLFVGIFFLSGVQFDPPYSFIFQEQLI